MNTHNVLVHNLEKTHQTYHFVQPSYVLLHLGNTHDPISDSFQTEM
jgi:hypothetical protein